MMTHREFVEAYAAGRLKVKVEPHAAAKYLSARLLLPLLTLPLLGLGVALALIGWIWAGVAVFALGIIGPRLIKRSAPNFVLTQAMQREDVYRELTRTGILRIDSDSQ